MSNNELNMLKISEIQVSYAPQVTPSERVSITSSSEAEQLFSRIWKYPVELKECFYTLFLNRANKVLGYQLISIGGVSGTVADPKVIFQTALKANASSVILAHNHPSGNGKPSEADIQLTRKLKEAGQLLEISVLDHLILFPEGYTSFADEGLI
ncbi:MAG: JAB domain-containing protein [Planctomycetota bacterium]|jgi:DNA repair protein RadC